MKNICGFFFSFCKIREGGVVVRQFVERMIDNIGLLYLQASLVLMLQTFATLWQVDVDNDVKSSNVIKLY